MDEEADVLETAQQAPIVEEQADDGQEQITAEDSGEDTADSGQEEKPKGDLPKGAQKRIDRLTRQKYKAQARAEAAERKFAELEKRLERIENPPKPRPKIEEFESREEYEDALLDWREQKSQSTSADPVPQNQEGAYRLPETWDDQVAEAEERYADFQAVVFNPNLQITDHMARTFAELDQGADVAYHLGKNPQLAARIAGLTPKQQERELVRIEVMLQENPAQTSQPNRSTSAPEPITPAGSTAKVEKEPHEMSASEFAAWRKKYQARGR